MSGFESMQSQPDSSRPDTAPDFLLSRASGSLRSQGVVTSFDSVTDAYSSLATGCSDLIVGAIGFNPATTCALYEPKNHVFASGPLEPPARYRGRISDTTVGSYSPSRMDHHNRVMHAVAHINSTELEKVVLARAITIDSQQRIDPLAIAARLIDRSPDGDAFMVDLSAAGGIYDEQVFVGSSPELLVKVHNNQVRCFPLAGSAARHSDSSTDAAIALGLQQSQKDLSEHAFVVENIAAILRPLCSALDVPATPSLTSSRDMWHLGTAITGSLKPLKEIDHSLLALGAHSSKSGFPGSIDIALALHPTPAVCGTPTPVARDFITAVEFERGFYAGMAGWSDSYGNGEWVVAIRCAAIHSDRHHATAWAGGGIVSSSDPASELAETDAKFDTITQAFSAPSQRSIQET